jgi:hypothetical protein
MQFNKARNITEQDIHTKRPLVYYYGYSHLMKGLALQKLKRYDESSHCINNYVELGWFNGLDEEGHELVERFRFNATANKYTLEILKGNKGILREYVSFLNDCPEEALPAHITILEAALAHNWDVDDYLAELAVHASVFPDFEDVTNVSYYVNYLYHLSLYYFCKDRFSDALDNVLVAFESSVRIEEGRAFKKCVALFESFRGFATPNQIQRYGDILKTTLEGELKNEKSVTYINSRIRNIQYPTH